MRRRHQGPKDPLDSGGHLRGRPLSLTRRPIAPWHNPRRPASARREGLRALRSELRGDLMGSVIKKRRKRMAKKKHRKLLRKTRHQRRNKK